MEDAQQTRNRDQTGRGEIRICEQPASSAAERDQQEVAQAGMVARRGFALRADQRADQQRRGQMRDCIGKRKAARHDFRL